MTTRRGFAALQAMAPEKLQTTVPENLTAKAARWSARHRWAAVLGWLCFVVVAFVIGQASGLVLMKDEDFAIGDSHAVEQVLAREFPTERARELVLIQSRDGRLGAAELAAAVDELVLRLSRVPTLASIVSPLGAGNTGQLSADGRSALVTFQIKGDPNTAGYRVGPTLAATAAVQRAYPTLYIGQVGDGSANEAISKRIADDFRRAEFTSLPVTFLILFLAFGALVAAGIPLLLGFTAVLVQGLPHDLPVMKVYDRVESAFPGGPVPALVAVSAPDVDAPAVRAGIEELRRSALASGLMKEPISVEPSDSGRAARIQIPLAGAGTDAASNDALDVLRDRVIPTIIGLVPGAEAHTTGLTAASRDFNDSMKSHAPLVFAFVLSMTFILLLLTLRSIVIPLKAIVLNLLSVGAAYGVLVLVFQDGRFESALGFQSIGGVTTWLPLFLFVILFGLSMDYHVLILSRVREAYDSGMPTDRAIAHGIQATASVVTNAAVVMVAVFAIFATLGLIDLKMMGVGLAVAVP